MARKKSRLNAKRLIMNKFKVLQPLAVLIITLTPTILQNSEGQAQLNPITWIWSFLLLILLVGVMAVIRS